MRDRPYARFAAAGAQAAEAAGVGIASVLSAVDTAAGKSYEFGSGVALTAIGFGTVAALAVVAAGVARARAWSWTPAMLIQLFTLITGIYLLQASRWEWGGPAVGLAVGVAVLLLLPGSLEAFGRRPPPEEATVGKRPEAPARSPGRGATRPRSSRP